MVLKGLDKSKNACFVQVRKSSLEQADGIKPFKGSVNPMIIVRQCNYDNDAIIYLLMLNKTLL